MAQNTITLPLLDVTMRLCKATNEKLAKASGVSCRTISGARSGKPIQHQLAVIIAQTLKEREFTRDNRGPKGGGKHGRNV